MLTWKIYVTKWRIDYWERKERPAPVMRKKSRSWVRVKRSDHRRMVRMLISNNGSKFILLKTKSDLFYPLLPSVPSYLIHCLITFFTKPLPRVFFVIWSPYNLRRIPTCIQGLRPSSFSRELSWQPVPWAYAPSLVSSIIAP